MYKKISYLLIATVALGFASCSDQNDVVDRIVDEAKDKEYVAEVEYTLTEGDYGTISAAAVKDAGDNEANKALASAVKSTNSLNDFVTADKYVPTLLPTKYPALRSGSTAQVTYSFTEDRPAYLANLADSPTEILISENFEGYNGSANPYEKWDQNGWKQFVAQGDGSKYWQIRAYSGNQYAQVTANGGVNETTEIYVVSPAISLTKPTGNAFLFDVCIGYWNYAGLSVLITEDAKAVTEPATVTWTDITSNFTIPTTPTSGYGTFASAGTMNLDAYAGKKIYIAFRYYGEKGTGNTWTTTYQVDNVKVVNGDPNVVPVPGAAYITDGTSWEIYEDGLSLTADDYAAMGLTSMNTEQASVYLPIFLADKFPYAQDGTKKAVVYSGGTDEYEFTGGEWTTTSKPVTRTEQFIYGGSSWIFDPTVNYTMEKPDHQLVIDYMMADPDLVKYVNMASNRMNEEFYYGFNSNFNNVSFRLSYRAASDTYTGQYSAPDEELHALDTDPAAQVKLLWKRLAEKGLPLYLSLKWPLATAQVQGVDVPYNITLNVYYPDGVTYQSSSINYPFTFQYKVAVDGTVGTPATFEYVSGAPAEYYSPAAAD